MTEFILKDETVKSFKFCEITNNAVITFDPSRTDFKKVLGRVAVGMTMKDGDGVIKIHDHTRDTQIHIYLLISLISVILTHSLKYKKSLGRTFYISALFSLVHTIGNYITNESFSTCEFRVSTLSNIETNEEFYHVEISTGNNITALIANIMGDKAKQDNLQLVYQK